MSAKVVSISSVLKKPVETSRSREELPDLSDQTINKFFKVADYIRSMSTDKAATIEITPDELKITTRHCGETQEGDGTVRSASVLQLTSSMAFEKKDSDVEDFRDVIDYLTLE